MLKKRTVIVSLALLGTILIAGVGVMACHRPPMFCGGAGHGKEFPNHVLENMDSKVKELDLTEPQQQKYQEIRAKVKGELEEMAQTRKTFFQEVKREMDKEVPDLNVLADMLKSHTKRFPDRTAFFVDQFSDLYGVLDKGQKDKVVAELKGRFKKFEACKAAFSS